MNQTDPSGLSSLVVAESHVGLLVCDSCKNFTPFFTPAVIPRSAKPVPELASNLIVLAPPVESPRNLPLWKISRSPVVLFTLAVTLVTLEPIAVATSDNAVPPKVISTPFIVIL